MTLTRQLSAATVRQLTVAAVVAGGAALAQAEPVIGLQSTRLLVTFDSAAPLYSSAPVVITGIADDEALLSIDLRPANGTVVALSSLGRLYTLNTGTAAATFLSTLSGATLSGMNFDMDFDPVADRLRVVSDTGQNLRVNVDTGAVTVDTAINGAVTGLQALAYTNNAPGATTLFGINSWTDAVYVVNSPDNGTTALLGPLGRDAGDQISFDIASSNGVAYAALGGRSSNIYTINLTTGAATFVDNFGIGGDFIATPLRDLTVLPEPGNYALLAVGLLAVGFLARRRQG